MDALVAELGAKEDGNFRMFGYVGEVNASVEALRGKMRDVSAELERWQGANAAQDSDLCRRMQVSGSMGPWGEGWGYGLHATLVMQASAKLSRQSRLGSGDPEQLWAEEGESWGLECCIKAVMQAT